MPLFLTSLWKEQSNNIYPHPIVVKIYLMQEKVTEHVCVPGTVQDTKCTVSEKSEENPSLLKPEIHKDL